MQWAIRGGGIGFLALASCASPATIHAVPMVKNTDHAIVLTERRVPAGTIEYVVRTDGGATLAVVQADTPGLRPGAPATVVHGDRTTLIAR